MGQIVGELSAGLDSEFAIHLGEVVFDRRQTDEHADGDILISRSLRGELCNL